MTREEAIKFAEHAVNMTDIPAVKEFYRMAAVALTQPSNEALTLEELRGMDGEPVFVQWTDNRILPRWYIVGCYQWNLMDFDAFEDYGKWLAYRRPPEGEADA